MKTCIVTGASGGIGGEIAKALAKQGYRVLLQGRNQEKLQRLKDTIDTESVIIAGDLNNENERSLIIEKISQYDDLSLVVNAAGISQFASFEQTSEAKIIEMMNTNLITPMLFIQALVQMKSCSTIPSRLHIVNVGSAFGYIGYPGFCAYSASKFGLRGFTESLRREYADTHISFAYFAPRATQTDINTSQVTQMNKTLGTSVDSCEFVAQQFIEFLSKHRLEATVGWPEKCFVKVNALLPKMVDSAIRSKLPIIKQFMNA